MPLPFVSRTPPSAPGAVRQPVKQSCLCRGTQTCHRYRGRLSCSLTVEPSTPSLFQHPALANTKKSRGNPLWSTLRPEPHGDALSLARLVLSPASIPRLFPLPRPHPIKMAPCATGEPAPMHLSAASKASTITASVLHGPRDLRLVKLVFSSVTPCPCFPPTIPKLPVTQNRGPQRCYFWLPRLAR